MLVARNRRKKSSSGRAIPVVTRRGHSCHLIEKMLMEKSGHPDSNPGLARLQEGTETR